MFSEKGTWGVVDVYLFLLISSPISSLLILSLQGLSRVMEEKIKQVLTQLILSQTNFSAWQGCKADSFLRRSPFVGFSEIPSLLLVEILLLYLVTFMWVNSAPLVRHLPFL